MKKIVITSTLVGLIASSVGMTGVSYANAETVVKNEETSVSPRMIPAWLDIFLVLGSKYGDRFIWTAESISRSNYYTKVQSGTIPFNQGNNGGSVQKELVLDENTNQEAVIWATRPPLLTGSVLLEIFRKGNHSPLVSKVNAPTQQYVFKPGALGNYIIDWSMTEKQNWNLQFTYTHRYVAIPDPMRTAHDISTETIGDHIFIKPSNSHANAKSSSIAHHELSLEQMYDQLYDEEINEYVYKFKNYKEGDSIIFKDKITNISYNSLKDATEFTFSSVNHGDVVWSFSGNITDQYSIGDELKLKFKIEKIAGNYEMVDYVNLANENVVPSINDFLIK